MHWGTHIALQKVEEKKVCESLFCPKKGLQSPLRGSWFVCCRQTYSDLLDLNTKAKLAAGDCNQGLWPLGTPALYWNPFNHFSNFNVTVPVMARGNTYFLSKRPKVSLWMPLNDVAYSHLMQLQSWNSTCSVRNALKVQKLQFLSLNENHAFNESKCK